MQTIGRYRVLGELGRGAMGIVYRAQDPAIGREVAIKTIRLSDLSDPAERIRLRERLFREAQSAGMLSHPGIVTIYDIAEEGDVAYIAMECVDGSTLDRMLASDPPDGSLVLSILTQTAAALDYAHKRGIIHRDIKPANIMMHERRIAKITDFGVARIQSHQMTQAGSMVGTPNYMSPEQIQGQEVDGRSDQFSLAVIAFELLTGEKPFHADSLAALAYRIVREEPAPVHRINPTLDWPVDTVIRRGLSKSAPDRYPTCSDFAFALENACRACRKWIPVAPGSAQAAATIMDRPAGQLSDAGRTMAAPVISAAPPLPVEPEADVPFSHDAETEFGPIESAAPPVIRDPAPLRWLRTLALILVGGGLVAAGILAGIRFLQNRSELAPPAAETPAAKPSELPGDVRQRDLARESASPPPVVPAPPKASASRTISARLVTNPPGAFMVIDGSSRLSCQSPCNLDLPAGRHTLAATMAGYRRTLRILELPRDNQIFLNLDRSSGTLMIRSDPRGASIIIDGQTRPEKTPAVLTLPTGAYKLELEYGGQREMHQVQIRDSAITNVAATFEGR